MCGSLFFSLESCNAHRLVILVYFSLSSWEKDYQKSQTGSNLCFIPTPSQALRATITVGAKDLDAEKRGIQTKSNHHITDITTRV